MRHLLLIAASTTPLLLAGVMPAAAQPHFGGPGFRHGGFHPRGLGMRPAGIRPAFPGYRPGFRPGWYGGWRHAGYPYRRYPYWGAASGLASAATLGALATYPAYPVYESYPAYDVVPAAQGGTCSTPVKTCNLYEPAPLGIGCSCRVPGGYARGVVVGP
jgi:hypothetical protein